MMYRIRTALKVLGDEDFIQTVQSGYRWNPEIEVESNYEILEKLEQTEALTEKKKFRFQIMNSYSNHITAALLNEPCMQARSTAYQSVYLRAGETLCGILEQEEFLPIDGTITVTKQVSIMDDGVQIPLEGSGLTYYVGLFTDAEGTKPYGTDHIKAITISEGAAGTAEFTHVPEGTYYVFETLEDGTVIRPDEHVDAVFPAFTSKLESAEQKVVFDPLLEVSQADVVFNNVLDELPSGFYVEAEILITKTVLDEEGEETEVDDTFYAGLFTKEDGKYVLNDVIELEQNDTVTAKVLVATGENPKASKYWIFETDEDGERVGGSGFGYKISGEGAVKVSKDELSAEIEIVNTVKTEEEIESESEAAKQDGVKTGDSTPVMMYAMLCLGALMMMLAMGVVRRRRG